jgi:hypothetical protein
MTKQICEIGASGWFYYKEIYYPLFPKPLLCRVNRLVYGLASDPLSDLSQVFLWLKLPLLL